jgi:hypothetical protein
VKQPPIRLASATTASAKREFSKVEDAESIYELQK